MSLNEIKNNKKGEIIRELSVIVPVFNGERTLEDCLRGIFEQNYYPEKFEVVVVNDGSKDKTEEIADKFPVELINFSRNKGRITARIIGVKKAKYKYLLFLDADCEPPKTWIQKLLAYNYQPLMGQVSNKSLLARDRLLTLIRHKYYKKLTKPTFLTIDNFFLFPKATNNFLCSKELFNKVNFKNIKETSSDDQYCLYEILRHKPILAVPYSITHHNEKDSTKDFILQIFLRGSRFSDFYFKKDGILRRSFHMFIFVFVLFSLLIFYLFGFGNLLSFYFLIFLLLFVISVFHILEKPQDIFIVITYIFPTLIAFLSGFIYRKLCKR